MPPSPASTSKLSVAQLQSLASKCGISKAGPRAALSQRLSDTLHNHKPLSPKTRVLSIDLGIRNLAFTLLSQPSSKTKASKPVIHAWQRLELAPAAAKVVKAKLKDDEAVKSDKKAPAQDFSPTALSAIALGLVKDHLLPLNPTHVVIERQRFRSGGGAAVFEWTVRVNTLESMLYAVFATLKGLGHWDGVVESVDPKPVGPFLLGEEGDEMPTSAGPKSRSKKSKAEPVELVPKAKKNSKENKKLKIDLLGKWLVDGTDVIIDGVEPMVTREAFLRKWLPKEKVTKGDKAGKEKEVSAPRTVETMKKLDDVADSLLQGVAWLRWQENKQSLLKEYRDHLS
jgi:cruciform cutting endonuclease 1